MLAAVSDLTGKGVRRLVLKDMCDKARPVRRRALSRLRFWVEACNDVEQVGRTLGPARGGQLAPTPQASSSVVASHRLHARCESSQRHRSSHHRSMHRHLAGNCSQSQMQRWAPSASFWTPNFFYRDMWGFTTLDSVFVEVVFPRPYRIVNRSVTADSFDTVTYKSPTQQPEKFPHRSVSGMTLRQRHFLKPHAASNPSTRG